MKSNPKGNDKMKIEVRNIDKKELTIHWDQVADADKYVVYWADADTPNMKYQKMGETGDCTYTIHKSTHIHQYIYVEALKAGELLEKSGILQTPVHYHLNPQLEKLNRGLIAVKVNEGIFLSWRMWLEEVTGYSATGMTGTDYVLYRNGQRIALVTDSTNYLDKEGGMEDSYTVAAYRDGVESEPCKAVKAWRTGTNYLEIPMQVPQGGVTPAGGAYEYSANDMSVGDVDGDGELEYFVKWDPSNSHDVSHKGYTGNCYIDCYKLDGRLLWRLDMGVNIRSGAHYTQFIVYDFNGDGKAEMSVKTAPGTRMMKYDEDGNVISEKYITMPEEDIRAGVSHEDNYVCSAEDYYEYLVELFMDWQDHREVKNGHWPDTLEECFGIRKEYSYPLSDEDARKLVDYFLDVYAPSRSEKNDLRKFEGFIFKGPEYLTMFSGEGEELETIYFPVPREDDGLMWGDYSWFRIEPCNRVDRFLSGVGYLDGERPYLIICRGYYTRATITAYDFFEGRHREYFKVDSGYVTMRNPFARSAEDAELGTDPVYGCLVGQGDHSLSVADVDGDGCHEIIYGAATIDHDGSVLYSSADLMPDGSMQYLGHGDSMHVANINPDKPGLEIFNVFEEGSSVPYGWALRDAETGKVLFGEPADKDLGRCMIGDICPDVRGLQVWAVGVYDCNGKRLEQVKQPGTNACIRWAADLSTQITDGVDYINEKHIGVIADQTHGVMLHPEGTSTNNGTKGNPCLIANVFGDFREQIILRTADSHAIRIYTNTEVTNHKLFTLLHDTTYRCGVAWQNNCYNQPCYTSFYYASDMDFKNVLGYL